MKGWYGNKMSHSLASKGIKTKFDKFAEFFEDKPLTIDEWIDDRGGVGTLYYSEIHQRYWVGDLDKGRWGWVNNWNDKGRHPKGQNARTVLIEYRIYFRQHPEDAEIKEPNRWLK